MPAVSQLLGQSKARRPKKKTRKETNYTLQDYYYFATTKTIIVLRKKINVVRQSVLRNDMTVEIQKQN